MNSIIRLCASAALASLFASSALADEGLYLRFGAGSGHVDRESFGSAEFEIGYVASAAVGYNWFFPESIADLRVEIEGSYRQNDLDHISGLPANGKVRAYSAMLNGIFDFRTTWPVVPYVGAGLGGTQLRYRDDGANGVFPSIDDQDTVFAFQFMGGLNFDLSDHLSIGAEYRFLETEAFALARSNGTTFGNFYDHHSLLLTLIVGF